MREVLEVIKITTYLDHFDFDPFNIQAVKIAIIDFRNFSFLMQIDLVDLDILLTL